MNESRLSRGAYLLWAIAYIPSMFCVVLLALAISAAVAEVPGYVSPRGYLYAFAWICVAFLIICVVFYAAVFRKKSLRPWILYVQALAATPVLTQFFVMLICLVPFPMLGMIVAVVLLVALLAFIMAAFVCWVKLVRRYCALQDSYPHNRSMLLKIIQESAQRFDTSSPRNPSWKNTLLQPLDDFLKAAYLKALVLLPYEQNEQIFVKAALSGSLCDARIAALRKLPYPEEREALLAIASDVKAEAGVRIAALRKLPYPEEREALVAVALNRNRAEDERLVALQKLPTGEAEIFDAVIAELEQSVLEISGSKIPRKGSELCVKARMLKQIYQMFSGVDRLQVADRSKSIHTDSRIYVDWADIPLCVGGTIDDRYEHEDTVTTTWYRDYTILEDLPKS